MFFQSVLNFIQWFKEAKVFEKRYQMSLVRQGHYCKTSMTVTCNVLKSECWIKGLVNRGYCLLKRRHQVKLLMKTTKVSEMWKAQRWLLSYETYFRLLVKTHYGSEPL